ncbi:bifunctional phosphopantothenoylcysteine decarboxylase/phosphopantothenate synthase [Terracoccus luteus]|uniref:Coenzyme A biosynthesis bifunctional protein CoaBC n=1 Tax=Terracoccus luteus TaxID=53356 RepID=A0A839Q0P2_9MICO|nr:bifunctional phosphopantothenoylcysteine decarboxylase/phosphopantothenate synthase [Terracoccus luteus]MBB2987825.1 phosphopantothenoylcysteine decarboxylase/phosphopantothenate--cysteine ligase [Terracoccus luteus]MCP2173476.1 phosphopantothenoylcysteine decarboxylase/phosphopantothenate--cysteine ligase [Terracoccus luteus]
MPQPQGTGGPRVVLGVAGGIAAYKAALLLRLFTESGHDVTVVPTAAALEFVGAPTWAALSGKPVHADVWSGVHEVPHVRIGKTADLVVVAPATADVLARAAHGLANDLLTNTLLTARCPVVFAPAMHTEMWDHPATRANVALLRERGCHVIEPAAGRLTGTDTGPGRLPEPDDIYAACLELLGGHATTGPTASEVPTAMTVTTGAEGATGSPGDLAGRHVVVSAGGTREPLDPVRYLGNHSSGKQGLAIARAALRRGADVTLVAANVTLEAPAGARVVEVMTTAELQDAVLTAAAGADAVVMAAAPADFRPATVSGSKIKKDAADPDAGLTVELVPNPDIVRSLVAQRDTLGTPTSAAEAGEDAGRRAMPVIVSFAAETGDAHGSVLEHARAKFARKGSDVQVVNEVGIGKAFGQDENTVHLMRRGTDDVLSVGPASKDVVADAVLDAVVDALG